MTEISLSEHENRPKSAKKQTGFPRAGIAVAVVVVIAGASFAAGMQYQKGKTPSSSTGKTTASSGSSGGGRFGGGFSRGNRAIGTVSAVSSTSITVQTRSGSSSTYTLTSSTTVTDNGQSSSVSNIQSGDTVLMTLDSSNTQDVTSIMLNPSFGGGFGAPGGASSGGSSTQSDSSSTDSATGTSST